jgi:hypothetical protein
MFVPHTLRRRTLAGTLAAALVAALAVASAPPPATAADDEPPERQYPFACTAQDHGLELLVDNQDGDGVEVRDPDTDELLGYSRDCEAATRHWYLAMGTDGRFHTIRAHDEAAPGGTLDDLADAAMPDGVEVETIAAEDLRDLDEVDEPVPYLVRHERGVINRFIYSISMLVPAGEVLTGDPASDVLDRSLWNDRLLFQFQGGVGIGHSQGAYDGEQGSRARAIRGEPDRLMRGYAVTYSTATRTSDHYNLLVAGRTAEQVKDHFVDRHGEPRYTVATGASGGAIMQHVVGQNHPDVIDAAIPQQSYPDMTTQTIHVGDCALLERWMDLDAPDAGFDRWQDWDHRWWLQGLYSEEGNFGGNATQFAQLVAAAAGAGYPGPLPPAPTGSSECLEAWLGLLPLAMNPKFGSETNWNLLDPDVVDAIEKTHWDDAREAYGTDPETGFARVPWDNVGVQYGLRALADGRITPEEFLDVNARAGSWKEPEEMVQEGFPFIGSVNDLLSGAQTFDPWSMRNANLSPGTGDDGHPVPAPRREGDRIAIEGAYTSGLVTMGDPVRPIPTIDVRPYLEHVYDMHNSHQSFAMRERLLRGQGHADNQAIWFLDTDEDGDSPAQMSFYEQAFEVMEEWMTALEAAPASAPGDVRPVSASDGCFDVDGDLIAAGDDVWAGILDDDPDGACTEAFPLYTTSRIEAGGPIDGDVYKCHTMPVGTAAAEGLYGVWEPGAGDLGRLSAIFPDGVCDYDLRGVADPRADVPGAVEANGGPALVQVTGAEPGATIEVRQGGEVVAEFDVDATGAGGLVGLEEGTYVLAQRVDGQRGLLSAPVTVTEEELHLPSFSDVPVSFVHHDAIVALAADGIVEGYADGTFRPLNTLTRGQLASAMQRHLQLPAGPTGAFPDVRTAQPHGAAIEALAAAGIIEGFADGTFGPNQPLRRDQLAGIVARAAGLDDVAGTSYSDTAGSTHRGAIEALHAEGVIRGYDDGTFRPRASITRGQFASILHGALDLLR